MRKDWVEVPYKNVVKGISTSKKKVKQRDYLQHGQYPIIDQGKELVGGYTDDESKLLHCSLPVIVFGDHTKAVKLIKFPFVPGADGTKVLEPKEIVDPSYLAYGTEMLAFKIEDKGYARHYQHIAKEKFPVAPLPEQRAIVAKIEQLFSELDNGVANLRVAKEKLEVYRQAVLKKAFEGELTSVVDRLRLVPLGDEVNIVSGSTPKGLKYVSNSGEIPFYKVSDMNSPGNEVEMRDANIVLTREEAEELRVRIFPKGTVIFPKRGGAILTNKKRMLSTDASFDLNIMGVVPNDNYSSKYLYYFFLGYHLGQLCDGSTVPQINNKHIAPLLLPKCSLSEQARIVEAVESRLSVCDNVMVNIEQGLEKAEALRQSILKKAFEGRLLNEEELEACRKEVDWEPADKLLERIKKQRNETV